MGQFLSGSKARVTIQPRPSWMGEAWHNIISCYDGVVIVIKSGPVTGAQAFTDLCPIEIKNTEFVATEKCISLFPVAWLQVSDQKIRCDCNLVQLLQRGCLNPNHL